MKVDGEWKFPLEILTDDNKPDGWHKVETKLDRLRHFILSHVLYRQKEERKAEDNSCLFDIPDPDDVVRLLWSHNQAIGFYTLKPKGSLVEERMSSYQMVMLDSAYVRKEHRGKGFGQSLLEDLALEYCGEDIGLSTPVSEPMYRAVERFLRKNPHLKYKLWELHGTGSEGNKKLLWLSIVKRLRNKKSSSSGPGL